MQFEQLETEVKQQLETNLGSGADVELEPETEAGYKIPTNKARVSVMYDQSEFDKQNSTFHISQNETGRIAIIIRARLLRGPNGIYTTAENCRRFLVGFTPSNWSKFWLVKFIFVKRENNVWEYALIFSSKCQIVEEITTETGPALTSATALYTDNQYN